MSHTDNFEAAGEDAPGEIASFGGNSKGIITRFHHALHTIPALVPLIVLVAAILVFGAFLGPKFFSPFRTDSNSAAGSNCRNCRRSAVLDNPDCRH